MVNKLTESCVWAVRVVFEHKTRKKDNGKLVMYKTADDLLQIKYKCCTAYTSALLSCAHLCISKVPQPSINIVDQQTGHFAAHLHANPAVMQIGH